MEKLSPVQMAIKAEHSRAKLPNLQNISVTNREMRREGISFFTIVLARLF
jgi:hypothetical protein